MKLFYVPCKNREEAKNISRSLVESSIAVCANIIPIESFYMWEGKLNEDNETALILKVLNKNEALVEPLIKKMHSYEIPFIGKIDISANKEYEDWAEQAQNTK